MTEGVKLVRFFLGANSPQGFVSRFDQLERQSDGWSTTIIKGGPGTGKSTLMKNISAAMQQAGGYIEEIYCSSDSGSLDALILHDQKTSVADGTAPHVLEPKYPGACDSLINLGEFWDRSALRAHRGEIVSLGRRIAELHARSTRFLNAYEALAGDNYRIALEHTNLKKICDYAERLCARELRHRPGAEPHEDVRFISAICERGVVVLEETARQLADRIYVLRDDNGAAAAFLLARLREHALARGYDIITCYCPTCPLEKIEHLFIPALSLGFVTSNRVHPLSLPAFRTVHARRFTDVEALQKKKKLLSFNRRAAAEMLAQSAECLGAAKRLHDELESYYIGAMDFPRLDAVRDAALEQFRRL